MNEVWNKEAVQEKKPKYVGNSVENRHRKQAGNIIELSAAIKVEEVCTLFSNSQIMLDLRK